MSAPPTPGSGSFSAGGTTSTGPQSGASVTSGGSVKTSGISATTVAMATTPGSLVDPITQMNTYKSYVSLLADPSAKDDSKQKAAQELSEDFEVICCYEYYYH